MEGSGWASRSTERRGKKGACAAEVAYGCVDSKQVHRARQLACSPLLRRPRRMRRKGVSEAFWVLFAKDRTFQVGGLPPPTDEVSDQCFRVCSDRTKQRLLKAASR